MTTDLMLNVAGGQRQHLEAGFKWPSNHKILILISCDHLL